ncbi:RNA polymerase II-associated [Syncephalis pseudoplumigaleata]|uniref:RNA polymerase II-associated n=1 Tax=Syncephalis pseudoplumigaleata TaxID=1712513 RepID=A0A4P9Z2N1_9FUNG|nr:RNA polymerase II-associated [Syncephalis pseudoplumigaleata]|eukprot:RKP26754.1 RNA polymerase II-associated [Syncephalis pseudoplumigaleata]
MVSLRILVLATALLLATQTSIDAAPSGKPGLAKVLIEEGRSAAAHSADGRSRAKAQAQQHNDFLCRPRYAGQLPALPFPAKLIKLPSTVERFSDYRHTSLVQKAMYPLLTNRDLGMPVETPELGLFDVAAGMDRPQPAGTSLDPKDQALLVPPMSIGASGGRYVDGRKSSAGLLNYGSPRGKLNVPWLRRTEYMSVEMGRGSSGGGGLHKSTPQLGDEQHAGKDARALDCSREAQLTIIEKSFERAAHIDLASLKHPRRPGVKAVSAIPLLPAHVGHRMRGAKEAQDEAYTHCVLEQPPGAPLGEEKEYAAESTIMRKAQRAIFKPEENGDTGEKYLACFLPTDATVEQAEHGSGAVDTAAPLEYELARDYSYEATPTEGGRHVMLLIRPDEYAGYAQLPTKLVLRRRRRLVNMPGRASGCDALTKPYVILTNAA